MPLLGRLASDVPVYNQLNTLPFHRTSHDDKQDGDAMKPLDGTVALWPAYRGVAVCDSLHLKEQLIVYLSSWSEYLR